MKRIGILSDTHIPRAAQDLPRQVYEQFRGVEMILHAGDLIEMAVVDKLRKIAPARVVVGNMDMDDVKESFPKKDVIEIGGFRIGLIHGYGLANALINNVSREFKGVDAIVFGHSHSPCNQKIKKVLFFNPGSPTDRIFAPSKTFGFLEIGDEIKGTIVRL